MSIKGLSFVVLLAVIALLPLGTSPSAWEPVAAEKEVAMPTGSGAGSWLLGPELLISEAPGMPGAERFVPAVAANFVRGETLVVWHNKFPGPHRDIYARRVTNDGRLLSWFAITAGPEDRSNPAAAYNAADAEYLVVWMKDVSGNGSQYEIWGRIIAWDNAYQKPEFQIMAWPNRTFWSPRVVYNHNRNEYLVVWNAIDTTTGLPNDVASRIIDRHGNLRPVTVLTTSTYPQQADVAYGWATDEYLVVFVRSYLQTATGNDIYALRVRSGNSVIIPPGAIQIETGAKNQNRPRVACDGKGDYAVVWEHEHQAGDRDIYGRRVNKNGTPDSNAFPISTTPHDESRPAIAASFNATPEYVAVWQRQKPNETMLGALRWGAGLPLSPFDVTGGAFWETVSPAVAFNPPHYFVAWEGDSTSDPTVVRQIFGRRWTPQAVMLPLVVHNWR
jgi:hypothetical protein